jgi:hypothetical protein
MRATTLPKRASILLAFHGALLLGAAAAAQDGEWRLSSGFDYSVGDYGETSDTTIVVVPLSAAYLAPRWSASITVPYATVDGPGVIVPGGGLGEGLLGSAGGPAGSVGGPGGLGVGAGLLPTPPRGPLAPVEEPAAPADPEENISESGLSDVTLRLGVTPINTAGGWRLALSGGLRAPTGDEERSLGTGEAAGSVSAGLSKRFGRSALYGVLGAEHAFESEADGTFAGVGAEGYVSDRTLMGASLAWSEATSVLLRDAAQASLYAGYDLSARLQVRAYGAAGLTDTSPDAAGGVRLVLKAE